MPRTTDGCDVCRSRKLRCQMKGNDSCERCSRSGIACPGRSSTPRKWKPRFHDAEKKPEKRSAKASESAVALRSARSADPVSGAINPAQQMRYQALGHFLESYLPDNGTNMALNHFCYMKTLATRDERNPALRSAIEAITIAHIGAECQDHALSLHGSGLYASALRQMTHMVSRNSVSEDTLAASILLGLCEFTPSTSDSNSWIKHVLGQQRMLQILGPKKVAADPFAFQLFLNVRNSATSLAMHTRKAIFFDQPEWLEITKTTALVDPWVALTNLSVTLPALLEELDSLAHKKDVEAANTALPMIEAHEKQLVAWHARYLANSAAKGPWLVEPSHMRYVKDLDPLPIFSQLYWFADFQAGNIYQCYWAILLGLARVRKAFETATGESLGPYVSQKDCAVQMAKVSAFSCQPRFGSVGRIAATVILKYASVAFHEEGCSEEAVWCSSLVGILRADGVCQPPIFFLDQSHLQQQQQQQDRQQQDQDQNQPEHDNRQSPTTTTLADGKTGARTDEQPEKITIMQNYGTVKPEPAAWRDSRQQPPRLSGPPSSTIHNAYHPGAHPQSAHPQSARSQSTHPHSAHAHSAHPLSASSDNSFHEYPPSAHPHSASSNNTPIEYPRPDSNYSRVSPIYSQQDAFANQDQRYSRHDHGPGSTASYSSHGSAATGPGHPYLTPQASESAAITPSEDGYKKPTPPYNPHRQASPTITTPAAA